MNRECAVDMIIGSGETVNILSEYGFELVESPMIIYPETRDYEIQEYPEEATPEVLAKTVKKPFDYPITFVYTGDKRAANGVINSFYGSLFSDTGDILTPNLVEIRNYLKKEMVKGYAKRISDIKAGFDTAGDAVMFTLTLFVNNPTICDHDIPSIRVYKSASTSSSITVGVETGGLTFTSVTIEFRADEEDDWTVLYTGANLTYPHTGLTKDTEYFYRAKTNASKYSLTSNFKTL